MAHHQYSTRALVIESLPQGEANRFFTLFTRDLGMIRGTAQGVRLSKSKLRSSLQEFSLLTVTAVRGKEVWRITNAVADENLFTEYRNDKPLMNVIAHIFLLLKRLLPGEDKNEKLFDAVDNAFLFLKDNTLNNEAVGSFERIVVLNILYHLGYMDNKQHLTQFIDTPLTLELIEIMIQRKKEALQAINSSLRETQL